MTTELKGISRRRALCMAAGAALLSTAMLAGTAIAQDFPSEPIRLIVPFPPGGATDTIGRQLAEGLQKQFDQPVIVENMPGAAGVVGVNSVVQSTPDGHTMVLAGSNAVAADPEQEGLPYDPATDLTPISTVAAIPYVVFANADFAPNTIQELVDAANAEPGSVTFASSGIGGPPHLASELLVAMTGIDVLHIPYAGAVPAITDVVAGEVNFMTGDVNTALPFIEEGRLKALATTGSERMNQLPDVPTVAESGVEGYVAEGWFGVYVAPGTPDEIVEVLNAAVGEALKEQAYIDRMASLGGRPLEMPLADYAAFAEAETKKRSELIISNNITLQ